MGLWLNHGLMGGQPMSIDVYIILVVEAILLVALIVAVVHQVRR